MNRIDLALSKNLKYWQSQGGNSRRISEKNLTEPESQNFSDPSQPETFSRIYIEEKFFSIGKYCYEILYVYFRIF